MFFDRFWFRFGTHFGGILGAKLAQNRFKIGPRSVSSINFSKNVFFHETV